ncbi:MAG: hypothetical protein ABIT83_16065 [Massilia sp.]
MLNARRYECFCIDPSEQWMYAGNTSGQISIIDIDAFEIVDEVQAHSGVMRAVVAHPNLPYIAAMATDRCVSIWRRGGDGRLAPICLTSYRDIPCSNEEAAAPPVISHSVALWFHDTERRLVVRTGNGGVVELAFDEAGQVDVIWSARLHADWDVQMVRYVPGTDLVLSAGRDGCLVLVDKGRELRRWQLKSAVAHWAEHVEGSVFLIASDTGRVAKVDINSHAEPVWGERFARDDMEYLTLNKTSGRVFATSFDRNVYEIDLATCECKGVAYEPGYKCIWAKSLERAPEILLVQSRNGGLYKADADTGRTLGVIKETPDALWSAINLPGGDLLAAGEGSDLTRLGLVGVSPISRKPEYIETKIRTDMRADSYTKRMVRQADTGVVVMGRTDGDIWIDAGYGPTRLLNVGSPVRDVAVMPDQPYMFAVTEDGRALKIDLDSGVILLTYQSPGAPFPLALWAIAYNPARDLLAFAEFGRRLVLVSASDFSIVEEVPCERAKRIRWVGPDQLLFGSGDEVHRFTLGTPAPVPLVTLMRNTVEDFIWDARKQYLVVISYQCTIALCDYNTGEKLDLVRDQMDYSKGLGWLDATSDARLYPWDFVTWGRSGTAHHFRIHDEKIVALGPLATVTTESARDGAGQGVRAQGAAAGAPRPAGTAPRQAVAA